MVRYILRKYIAYLRHACSSNFIFLPVNVPTAHNIILNKKKAIQRINGKPREFVLIIKSADGSTFQNFVDMVDEVTINNIIHYYIDEINAEDKNLFSQK